MLLKKLKIASIQERDVSAKSNICHA